MTDGSRHRTGVILAAGFGSRLASNGQGRQLKPLVRVGGQMLILRAIRSLEKAGCLRVVIVLGYEPEALETAIRSGYDGPAEVVFVINDRFDLQNGVSVLAAAPWVTDEFVLVMADHVVDDLMMAHARAASPPAGGASLLVDYKVETIFDMDDATKVQAEGGLIVAIGKKLDTFNCIDTGVFVCTRGLLDALSSHFDAHGDVSLSNGIQVLANRGVMSTVDVGEAFWQDVDTPEMLAFAEKKLGERLISG